MKPEFLIKDLEFLDQYPRLQTLSLDMTEEKFWAIAIDNDLRWRKSVTGVGSRYRISTGDGHAVVVMFDKTGERCAGIQYIRGEERPTLRYDDSMKGRVLEMIESFHFDRTQRHQ